MKISISNLEKIFHENKNLRTGCVLDTNTVFAASMPLDRLNEWSELVFSRLNQLKIPAFTNFNIRSEFIDLHRRVLIPEGLVTFYDDSMSDDIDPFLRSQLRSLKAYKAEITAKGKILKFTDQQVKKYRKLFEDLFLTQSGSAWENYCTSYLKPYLLGLWDKSQVELNFRFLGTDEIQSREYFFETPTVSGMTEIMGRFGIGSGDAMIINFFLCSKFDLIITGDEDVAYAVEKLSNGNKFVLTVGEEEEFVL